MKMLRTLFILLLVLILPVAAGLLIYYYVGWEQLSYLFPLQTPGIEQQDTATRHGSSQGHGQTAAPVNIVASQNRDRLDRVIAGLNEAIDLITIDPYSKITVPSDVTEQTQPQPNNTNIFVYPGGSNPINIIQSNPELATPSTDRQVPPDETEATADRQNVNTVYDQSKLQQIHRAIYRIAQGSMLINELRGDLTAQTAIPLPEQADYQWYLLQYNIALQNRTKLNEAISLLNEASTLINVNPYAAADRYRYNVQEMARLHQGIFILAQSVTQASRLDNDFTVQLSEAITLMRQASPTSGLLPHDTNNFLTPGTLTQIFGIILVIMVIGFILSMLGAILRGFRSNNATD